MKQRIGLFGGTFDPIHMGHLRAAEEVLQVFSLGRILFVPSFIPPHKEREGIAPAGDRMRMVKLACVGRPNFSASSLEVDAGEKSYSILTLARIKGLHPGASIFFILGTDAFLDIGAWKDYLKVLDECHFIVISRPGVELESVPGVLGGALRNRMVPVSREEKVGDDLLDSPRVFLRTIHALDISATEIRRRVAAGEEIAGLVPEEVEGYIRSRHLYQQGVEDHDHRKNR